MRKSCLTFTDQLNLTGRGMNMFSITYFKNVYLLMDFSSLIKASLLQSLKCHLPYFVIKVPLTKYSLEQTK